MTLRVSTAYLTDTLQDARSRTLELVNGLDEEQLMGPQIRTVNPLRWEIGHVAYFYEFFIAQAGCILQNIIQSIQQNIRFVAKV